MMVRNPKSVAASNFLLTTSLKNANYSGTFQGFLSLFIDGHCTIWFITTEHTEDCGLRSHMLQEVLNYISDNSRGTWFEYMSDWAKFTQNTANNAHLVVYEDLKQVNLRRNLHVLEFMSNYACNFFFCKSVPTMCFRSEPSGGNSQASRVFGSFGPRWIHGWRQQGRLDWKYEGGCGEDAWKCKIL